jgi:ribonuclease III, bacterial
MTELERTIGYTFGDTSLLSEALTHSSYANETGLSRIESNERFEFLGDSVLSIIVSDYLFAKRPKLPEGELTKQRAALVCEGALAKYADEINLGDSIKLGKGEIKGGGNKRPSTLANCFEALLAAIYLDGGIEPARFFVLRFVRTHEDFDEDTWDYKTELQEVIQKNPEERVRYFVVAEEGPDHDKTFTVEVRLNSNVIGVGKGHSKKQAEQRAAQQALALMGL